MPWPSLWPSSTKADKTEIDKLKDEVTAAASRTKTEVKKLSSSTTFSRPETWLAAIGLSAIFLGSFRFYRTYLRRIPEAINIKPSYFRKRSIIGKVTSVGDGDNFRIFHTPGGRLAGWGWLPGRRVPKDKKELKNQTIHVRLAGIDAPELAHFGRPAQPYGQEALDWLTSYISGRRVRAYVHKADQYSRVVATAYVWKGIFRRDIGLQMLRAGMATIYEAKTGAEFGKGLEGKYRSAEQWAKLKRKGIWAANKKDFESPREYKSRYGSGSPIEPEQHKS